MHCYWGDSKKRFKQKIKLLKRRAKMTVIVPFLLPVPMLSQRLAQHIFYFILSYSQYWAFGSLVCLCHFRLGKCYMKRAELIIKHGQQRWSHVYGEAWGERQMPQGVSMLPSCPSLLSVFYCYDKTSDQGQFGEKKIIWLTLPCYVIIHLWRVSGQKLEVGTDVETVEECCLLTSLACSVCFIMQPKTIWPGMTLPTVG